MGKFYTGLKTPRCDRPVKREQTVNLLSGGPVTGQRLKKGPHAARPGRKKAPPGRRGFRFLTSSDQSLRSSPEAFFWNIFWQSSAINAPASTGGVPALWMLETTVRLASGIPG